MRSWGTYSIAARDAATGQMGVAVQSHWFGVGRLVCWAEAGVGAVATQATVEVSYGPHGLALLRDGIPAPHALARLLAADDGRDLRQVGIVDALGLAAAHTGARCIAEAGHEVGDGFSAQANIMARRDVWPAMAHAFSNSSGELSERLLRALEAAEAAGGDLRGKQSAAMIVVKGASSGKLWQDAVLDLRVEDHAEPLAELRRLVRLNRAYDLCNQGDALLGQGDAEAALARYQSAAEIAPHIAELPFWHAVTLADLGRVPEALTIFRDVLKRDPALAVLLRRLPGAGLLRIGEKAIDDIVTRSR